MNLGKSLIFRAYFVRAELVRALAFNGAPASPEAGIESRPIAFLRTLFGDVL